MLLFANILFCGCLQIFTRYVPEFFKLTGPFCYLLWDISLKIAYQGTYQFSMCLEGHFVLMQLFQLHITVVVRNCVDFPHLLSTSIKVTTWNKLYVLSRYHNISSSCITEPDYCVLLKDPKFYCYFLMYGFFNQIRFVLPEIWNILGICAP